MLLILVNEMYDVLFYFSENVYVLLKYLYKIQFINHLSYFLKTIIDIYKPLYFLCRYVLYILYTYRLLANVNKSAEGLFYVISIV